MNQDAELISAILSPCHHNNQSLPRLPIFSYSFLECIRVYPGSVGMCKMESLSRNLFADVVFVLPGMSVLRAGIVHPKLLWAELLLKA